MVQTMLALARWLLTALIMWALAQSPLMVPITLAPAL